MLSLEQGYFLPPWSPLLLPLQGPIISQLQQLPLSLTLIYLLQDSLINCKLQPTTLPH